MRYRRLDANGDYSFGRQSADFYIDEPRAVAQAAMTRLMLYFGEWFLDTSDGTRWYESILGVNTRFTRDLEIKARVLGTPNVTEITSYSSNFDGNTRAFRVSLTINTPFGPTGATVVAKPTGEFMFTLDDGVLGRLG